ncbi:type IV secretory system conjugative DNA transfer family protein [Bradyrhizobium japonicum]|uniref:type IV secretory system conjugative DNA transfer family protein n=1 Tax=Bradyrhizobium japonicum TaxID=375 RepID=UPI0006763BD1|nr:type IV secretory system conjugative DNA transfer family protein [Bradyrhizobium japonicum]
MTPRLPRGIASVARPQAASSRWAEQTDIPQTEGLIVHKDLAALTARCALLVGQAEDGSYVGVADDRHCLTVAGSRAGKGTTLIVPNLLIYPGSVLCIDPKGENARLTAARRQAMGQDVYVLDPFRVSGIAERAAYNPFSDLDPGDPAFIDDASLLADGLITDKNRTDPHWDEAARELIKGLILHLKLNVNAPSRQNLCEMRRVLSNPDLLVKEILEMQASEAADGVVAAIGSSFEAKPAKERDSVLSTALRHTEFLDSPGMRDVLGGASAAKVLPSLKNLRAAHRVKGEKPVTIYLCLPASRMPTHARWLRALITFALALLEKDAQSQAADETPSGPPVLFLMDEFSSLGHMPSMAIAAGLMAGFGVRLWPFLQDLSQLQQHYEKGWETFVGNAGAQLFFGNTDLTTLRHVSERLGKTRIVATGLSMPTAGDESMNLSELTTPLLATDEIQMHFARRRSRDDFLILLLPHSAPIALTKTPYFRDRNLAALLGLTLPPEPPKKKKWGMF